MKRIATLAGVAAVGLLVMAPTLAGQRPSFDVLEKAIPELAAAMTAGTVTSQALVQAYLARIDAFDPTSTARWSRGTRRCARH
jgi:hypothetical protein